MFTAGSGDPNFSKVELLMHFENSWADSSSRRISLTPSSGAGLGFDATNKALGGWSGTFGGNDNDYLSLAHDARFSLGAQDMTVEAWVRTTRTAAQIAANDAAIISKSWLYGTRNPNWALALSKGYPQFTIGPSSTAWQTSATSATRVLQNAWNHIVGQRRGNLVECFVNGALVSSVTETRVPNESNPTGLRIGKTENGSAQAYIIGQLDEIRLTMGVARYPDPSFVVPTFPYPDF